MARLTAGDRVLDAYAVLAYLQGEPNARKVETFLSRAESGRARLFLSMINAGEIFYRLRKVGEKRLAEDFVSHLLSGAFPVESVPATDARVVAAARVKALFPISFADAFAVALAAEKGLPVLTGDPEFRAPEAAEAITVDWL